MKTLILTLPEWMACPLINGERGELSDEECRIIEVVRRRVSELGYSGDPLSVDPEPEFLWNPPSFAWECGVRDGGMYADYVFPKNQY